MYIVLGGGKVISSDDVLMIFNLKGCEHKSLLNIEIVESDGASTHRTLVITVDGKGIYTNSLVSTIVDRIKRWRDRRNV
ncbi:MAG: hypothetical protein J7M13_01995 [Synergistetes bacterium]|nr:hypothetical protein [Synergistota bacterium]